MFHDVSDFDFVERLERAWRDCRRELDSLDASDFVQWPEPHAAAGSWRVFGLYVFGRKLDRNCQRCPQTAALVESVPGMLTAGFSALAGGAHIRPHVGYTDAILRCHLGLKVPTGCSLRVGPQVRDWREGECLVFNDTQEHEAWNRSAAERVVLLMDVLLSGREADFGGDVMGDTWRDVEQYLRGDSN